MDFFFVISISVLGLSPPPSPPSVVNYSNFAHKYFYSFVNAFLLFMNEATTRNLCIPHSFVTISVA
jgi:hypothetical protein